MSSVTISVTIMASRGTRHKHKKLAHKKTKDPFDYVVYTFGVVTPLFELPQLWIIYSKHTAQNISLATWAFFSIDNLVWLAYAIRKKDWPLIITSIIYETLEVIIVIGIILYS